MKLISATNKKWLGISALSAVMLVGLAVAAYQHEYKNSPKAYAATPSSTTPCVGNPAPAKWNHVIVLMFENKTYAQVIGSSVASTAPFINGLATKCGTVYSGTTGTAPKNNWHDANFKVNGATDGNYNSKPSYATLTSGVSPSVHGLKDDTYGTQTAVENIYDEINKAGKTAKNYYEGSASATPCASSNFSGAYHDPIRYFSDLSAAYCNAHDVPISTFMTDVNNGTLPNFSFILPTNSSNMHDNSISSGDTWAKNFLTPLLDSAQYKSGDTAIYFLWDEDTPTPNVLLAPSVAPGSKVPVPAGNPIGHIAATRSWAEMLGLPFWGDLSQAPSLLSFFNGCGTSCTPPPPDNPPTVSITAPAAGTTLTTSPVTVSANAADDHGVVKVEFYSGTTLLNTDTAAPFSFSWDVSKLSGSQSLTAKAYDTANQITTSAAVTVTVSIPPSCSVPTTLGVVTQTVSVPAGSTYHVWSRIMAPDTTNNSYYLQIDGGCPILVGDSTSIPANAWTWLDYQGGSTTTHTSATLTAGNHTLTMIGHEAGVKLDRVLLLSDTCVPSGNGQNCSDSTPPTVQITSPTASQTVSGSVNIAATVADNSGGSGLQKVEYLIDNGLLATQTTGPFQTAWNTALTADGSHAVNVRATDIAGNVSTGTVTVTVANNTAGIVGDLNSDGHVNIFDLSLLLSKWGSPTPGSSDLNNDGKVDLTDLSLLLSHFGV